MQGSSIHYQFATAHYFGRLLGIGHEPDTIQDWKHTEVSLPAVHWSEQQQQFFNQNLPAAELTQTLSYDAPEVTKPAPEPIVPVSEQLVDADSHEAQPVLLSDEDTSTQGGATQGGGGSAMPVTLGWLCLLLMINRRKRAIAIKA